MKGITFGNYHSYDDFHLILGSQEIGSPDVKENKIKIEGADGDLDFTDFFGSPKYENVRHKFNFSTIVPQAEFLSLFSTVKNAIHGKKLRIILDDDPLFYYIGRCFVSKFTNEKGIGIVSVECDCEPYKYKIEKTYEIANLGGKNMLDLNSGVINLSGGWTKTETGYSFSRGNIVGGTFVYFTIPVKKGITYSFSATGSHGAENILNYVYSDKMYGKAVGSSFNGGAIIFTAEKNGNYIFAIVVNSTTASAEFVNLMLEIGATATEYEPFDHREKTVSVFLENIKIPAVPTITAQHDITITNGEETLVANEGEPLISPEFQLSEGINQFNITGIGLVAFEWQEGGL